MPRRLVLACAVAGVAAGALHVLPGSGSADRATGPRFAGCPVFPSSSAWNRDVSRAPVDPRSDAYIAAIGPGNLHADFGSGRFGDYGLPVTVVPSAQPRVPVRFTAYGAESDPGPYPVPLRSAGRGRVGSTRHRRQARALPPVRALRRPAGRRRLGGGERRGVRPALQPQAPRGLDVG